MQRSWVIPVEKVQKKVVMASFKSGVRKSPQGSNTARVSAVGAEKNNISLNFTRDTPGLKRDDQPASNWRRGMVRFIKGHFKVEITPVVQATATTPTELRKDRTRAWKSVTLLHQLCQHSGVPVSPPGDLRRPITQSGHIKWSRPALQAASFAERLDLGWTVHARYYSVPVLRGCPNVDRRQRSERVVSVKGLEVDRTQGSGGFTALYWT
ncbi:hypothetical protein ElyMa_002369400 [Elysia marginata]|uniref:Uncharacterized protein n=1 Tax=Elysia marginata TaxID=1093978 RepID=A0AAV4GCD7_9GAST|nr:hypothetical protein ElyMa_002369400 [Elysia marginata]